MADAAALRTRFDALARAYPSGQHGRWAARERADALDGWFTGAIERAPDGVAILALGGWGRGLQPPGSGAGGLVVPGGLAAAALASPGGRPLFPPWGAGW